MLNDITSLLGQVCWAIVEDIFESYGVLRVHVYQFISPWLASGKFVSESQYWTCDCSDAYSLDEYELEREMKRRTWKSLTERAIEAFTNFKLSPNDIGAEITFDGTGKTPPWRLLLDWCTKSDCSYEEIALV